MNPFHSGGYYQKGRNGVNVLDLLSLDRFLDPNFKTRVCHLAT